MWKKDPQRLTKYQLPDWASTLKNQPKSRVKLANLPTPIQYWPIPDLPEDFTVFIKRDDMIGSTLSGNKTRKLEFTFADAIEKGFNDVITIGNSQSNHVRTTMMGAKEVGLQGHCVCYAKEGIEIENIPVDGNMYLTKMSGCHGYFVLHNRKEFLRKRDNVLDQAIDYIRETTGRHCYKIPLGGSDLVGVFGYIDAYEELLQQGLTDHVTDIVVTAGTAGTLAGLAIGNYLAHGKKIKVHGYSVALELQAVRAQVDSCLQGLGLTDVTCDDIVTITDSIGIGYAQNTPQELAFIEHISKTTGILLDTSYTGKTAYRMIQDIQSQPGKFQGKSILFIHTGGIYKNLTTEKLGEFSKVPPSDRDEQIWAEWKPVI